MWFTMQLKNDSKLHYKNGEMQKFFNPVCRTFSGMLNL